MDFMQPLQVIWDYLGMHQQPEKADCIVGFGNFNTDIARRAAELYHQGYAPKILFTGGLGRNTEGLLPEPEAVRFARVAMECGVPDGDIILEDRSSNTKENIEFTRELLSAMGVPHGKILGVHQPFMERRITAAMGVYWPELDFCVTSPQVTIPEYLERAKGQGISENASISVIVGDFQRMDLYARLGYQLPQVIPQEAWDAFHTLVAMGYDKQLAK
ncbi:MAG: YdcF family protein [Oscillospiraceae bacterium]|nr:YdcF family protein [Oscillospiraceae bacterium]MBQ7129436.1 YdcF family protein [Oscillospiraceae bacterium]